MVYHLSSTTHMEKKMIDKRYHGLPIVYLTKSIILERKL